MAVQFLTGQRLTADLINGNIIDYMPSTTTKTVVTSRASTITLADDPELAGIALGVGTWEVELLLHFTVTTTTTQKIKTRWAFTGTWNGGGGIRNCIGPSNVNTANTSAATETNVQAYTLDTQDATYNAATAGGYSNCREICRNVVVTVAGNMSLQWAQVASIANNTNVQGTSSFTVRKISD